MQVVDAINHGYIKVVADLHSFRVDYVHGDDRAVHDSFTLQFPRSILGEQPRERVESSRVQRVREAINRRRMYNDAKARLKRKFAADDHVVE